MTHKAAMWKLSRGVMLVADTVRWLAVRIQDAGNKGYTRCHQCGERVPRAFTDLTGICKDCW